MSAFGRHLADITTAPNHVRFGGNVLQNSANERSTSKSGQYQNLKRRFRESKFPIRLDLENCSSRQGAK
jgi:hypothetical protein